ncbi:bifunctional metallophosphatase/5'-nucleotidase [Sutcliffiella deserti]|uniref:bifunctional metallophosphatase/5'-nucleotidase n=1 Tax=Sutcliffiella deserti TaxID=2875501 RepID=UPI001CBEE4BA|nr:bifunctional UDP-sugar hydrolase/5'-nucleotidase [Sutcliffiella deserti]
MVVNITILETSDVHGNVLPINYGDNSKSDVGLAKLASLIKEERKKHENVLVIDNGDLVQGTPLTYHYVKKLQNTENPMVRVLNHLKFDAAVVGNHEFNYGMNILKNAVKDSDFPWLSANILSETGDPFLGKPYIIKTFETVKIAVLGVTTHYIPNWENPTHVEGLTFEDALESTKKWVKHLKDTEEPDLIVVSYHGGFERNLVDGSPTETLTSENQGYEICKSVKGIDVLLTGHQHRSIAEMTVNGVLVLQPGVNGETLGKATIQLEKKNNKWEVVSKQGSLLSTKYSRVDADVAELIKEYEQSTQTWLDQPIGNIKGNMAVNSPFEVRLKDNELIEFINKVQMEVSNTTISNTALFHNSSPGFPTNVTMRDIVSNYIYPNTLKVIRISGQDIKDALERSASYFLLDVDGSIKVNPSFTIPKPQHYNYDMWEGINYTIDIRKPIGERVVKLERDCERLDLKEEYDVVMNNYRAGGGGDYIMYQNKQVVKDIPLDMSELIANYIMEKGTIEATVNHNWKVIWNEQQA